MNTVTPSINTQPAIASWKIWMTVDRIIFQRVDLSMIPHSAVQQQYYYTALQSYKPRPLIVTLAGLVWCTHASAWRTRAPCIEAIINYARPCHAHTILWREDRENTWKCLVKKARLSLTMGRSEANGNGILSNKKIKPDQIKKIGSIGNGSLGSSERSPMLYGSSEPKDTCHLAYIIFYLHGIGHLLPWNFFITATLVK